MGGGSGWLGNWVQGMAAGGVAIVLGLALGACGGGQGPGAGIPGEGDPPVANTSGDTGASNTGASNTGANNTSANNTGANTSGDTGTNTGANNSGDTRGGNPGGDDNRDGGGDDRPQVVATSTILASLTAEIAGDTIALTGLLQPGADPHVYEPVPQDSRTLERADLIIYNGYNLEPGLIRLIEAAGITATNLPAGEKVPPLQFDYQGQRQPDPHVWGDVANGMIMAEAIATALGDLAPDQRPTLERNKTQLLQELTQLDTWVTAQIATIPPGQRRLVTTHDAFQYYAHAYGLEVVGTLIGISTEEQPSAQTVRRLVESVRQATVPAIFAETTLNPQLIRTVAEEAGVQLAPQQLYSDSLGAVGSGAETYGGMIEQNTRTIVQALGGRVEDLKP